MAKSLAETPHFQNREKPARLVGGKLQNATHEAIDMDSLADRVQVRAPRDQRHVMSGLVQPGADDSTDRAGAEHDEAHQSSG